MAQYIILINWTDQGIRNVKESPKRLDTARAVAKKLDMELKDFYLTMGDYDMVGHVDAPNDEICCEVHPRTRDTRKREDQNAQGILRRRIPQDHCLIGVGDHCLTLQAQPHNSTAGAECWQ